MSPILPFKPKPQNGKPLPQSNRGILMKVCALAFSTAIFLLFGCGGSEPLTLEVPQYAEMRNIGESPAAIQKAARAIVRIDVTGSHGTGTFISADGLLLTNNHVLGVDNHACAAEGCYLHIAVNYQIGVKYQPPVKVFAKPVGVSPEWDASLFQLWTDASETKRFAAPHHLEIESQSGSDLLEKTVYVVGHPLASVKKWTSGRVYRQNAKWISSTNFSLPGNSGSPFLNADGKIVGLVHRASMGNDEITRKSVLTSSTGTPSSHLLEFKNGAPRLGLFYSVKAEHKVDEAIKHQDAYYMNQQGDVMLPGGARQHMLDLLATSCDEALLGSEQPSPEALMTLLSPCSKARNWINCLHPKDDRAMKKCPVGADKTNWSVRFAKAAQLMEQYNAQQFMDFLLVSSQLETSQATALPVLQAQLAGYVTRTARPLSFELAVQWLDAFGTTTSYQGVDVAQFLVDYKKQTHYEYYFGSIIEGHALMLNSGIITGQELLRAYGEFFQDEKLDLGNKLELESTCYQVHLFPY